MTILVVITFLVSIVLGAVTIPNIIIISKRKRLFDGIDARKVHTTLVPRLGGVSFMPSIIFSFCIVMGLRSVFGYDVVPVYQYEILKEFSFVAAGLILIFLSGIADDLIGVGYKKKFIVQILAALLIIASDIYIKNLYGIFGLYEISAYVGIPLTIFLIVGIVNAFNLIDGMDGLCSGLSIISLSSLILWFWYYDLYTYAMLGASALGTLIVFFFFNVSTIRKKIFMGDCGSLILGYVISFLGLKYIDLSSTVSAVPTTCAPLIFLSIVFIPVFDTLRVFAQRLLAHKSPFNPDKTHIHHLFLALGYTHLQSTGLILICAFLVIIMNILLSNFNVHIMLIADILFGMVFLNLLPKKVASKRRKINK